VSLGDSDWGGTSVAIVFAPPADASAVSGK
jgi:hypothetical protein